MRAFYYIIPQKTETFRTILTAGGNNIYYLGEVSMPTSYLTTIKLNVNSTISNIKSRYICMDVENFYLNNMMDRSEYTMIQISMIPQYFLEK